MISIINQCFSWLPLPLAVLVNAIISIFVIIVAFQCVKLVVDIVKILAEMIGGIFTKILSIFL